MVKEEQFCSLKTKKEIIEQKRAELNQTVSDLFALEDEYRRKKNELEEKARELQRQILKGVKS